MCSHHGQLHPLNHKMTQLLLLWCKIPGQHGSQRENKLFCLSSTCCIYAQEEQSRDLRKEARTLNKQPVPLPQLWRAPMALATRQLTTCSTLTRSKAPRWNGHLYYFCFPGSKIAQKHKSPPHRSASSICRWVCPGAPPASWPCSDHRLSQKSSAPPGRQASNCIGGPGSPSTKLFSSAL